MHTPSQDASSAIASTSARRAPAALRRALCGLSSCTRLSVIAHANYWSTEPEYGREQTAVGQFATATYSPIIDSKQICNILEMLHCTCGAYLQADASKEPLKLEQLKEAAEILTSDARRSEYDANYTPSDSGEGQADQQPSGKQGGISASGIKQQAKDALDRAQNADTPAIETVPDNVLGKVADLMSESLGNGKLYAP